MLSYTIRMVISFLIFTVIAIGTYFANNNVITIVLVTVFLLLILIILQTRILRLR